MNEDSQEVIDWAFRIAKWTLICTTHMDDTLLPDDIRAVIENWQGPAL